MIYPMDSAIQRLNNPGARNFERNRIAQKEKKEKARKNK